MSLTGDHIVSEADKVGEVLPDALKRFYANPAQAEAERHECECRHVARLMWRDNESNYLSLVEKNRGKEAAGRLRDRAREIVREYRK